MQFGIYPSPESEQKHLTNDQLRILLSSWKMLFMRYSMFAPYEQAWPAHVKKGVRVTSIWRGV
jgi:hypothetical protein